MFNLASIGRSMLEAASDLGVVSDVNVAHDNTLTTIDGTKQSPAATVFFARCPPVTTEEQVHQVFSKFGQITEVNLYRRWQSAKTSKGCGFVRFKEHAAAAAALEALNGKFMFDTSEAPMVVEWIDPTRLVTRQHTAASKQSALKKSRRGVKEQIGGSLPSAYCQQTPLRPIMFGPLPGSVMGQSRVLNRHVSSCINMGHCTAAMNLPLTSSVQDQETHECLPVHMLQMQAQCELPAPVLTGSGFQAVQHVVPAASGATLAISAPALTGPASPLKTYQPLNLKPDAAMPQLAYGSDAAIIPTYIPMNYSCVADINQTVTDLNSAQITASNSTQLTCMDSLMQSTTGPHVLCLDDVVAASSCVSLQLNEAGEQLSGRCTASGPWVSSCGSAAVLSASSGYAPMCSGAATSDYVSSFSQPLLKTVGPGITGGKDAGPQGAEVGAWQQLQALTMAVPAVTTGDISNVNSALQPLVNGLNHSNTNSFMGVAKAPEPSVHTVVEVKNNMRLMTNESSSADSQVKATIAVEPTATADIISSMEFLNEISGAQVALTADGQGVQLQVTGKLVAVDAAYQMICLLCRGKHMELGALHVL